MTAIGNAIEALTSINAEMQSMRSEIDNLRAIKAWALEQLKLDFKPGDRVVIVDDFASSIDRNSGWWHYREALAPGQTGIAGEIYFSATSRKWRVDVGMDRSWSVSDGWAGKKTRYWNGPAEETPDGYVPPTPFDQERHPGGKVKHFYMDVSWLAKAEAHSEGQAA